eukprot:2784210-Rhodomonas_salina.1
MPTRTKTEHKPQAVSPELHLRRQGPGEADGALDGGRALRAEAVAGHHDGGLGREPHVRCPALRGVGVAVQVDHLEPRRRLDEFGGGEACGTHNLLLHALSRHREEARRLRSVRGALDRKGDLARPDAPEAVREHVEGRRGAGAGGAGCGGKVMEGAGEGEGGGRLAVARAARQAAWRARHARAAQPSEPCDALLRARRRRRGVVGRVAQARLRVAGLHGRGARRARAVAVVLEVARAALALRVRHAGRHAVRGVDS